jgi:hypothetical protein
MDHRTGFHRSRGFAIVLTAFLEVFIFLHVVSFRRQVLGPGSEKVQSPKTGSPSREGVTNVVIAVPGPMLKVGLW